MTIQREPGRIVQGTPGPISRRAFLGLTGMSAAAFVLSGSPFAAVGARTARGQTPPSTTGYGPLVPKAPATGADKGEFLALPAEFNYQIISRQGLPMSDGNPTPGIFDGMGAFRGSSGRTILIRNHENRRQNGEIPVVVPADKRYDPDPTYTGGDTKLVVSRRRTGRDPATGQPLFTYRVERDFAILGGTDTNCAGGMVGNSWITCEEVVNRGATGLKHGYNYEIPAFANGPVEAEPIVPMGRFVHEAVAELDGIIYETEDQRISGDPTAPAVTGRPERKPLLGACFYRYIPDDRDDDDRGSSGYRFADGSGKLQALKLKEEFHANMDQGRVVGRPYPVEWVDIDDVDPEDDTDNRRDRAPGFTPVRVQAQDKGAAFFDREEGIWVARDDDDDEGGEGKVYFDCTEGGTTPGTGSRLGQGQVWEYDPRRETITLIFESPSEAVLDNPDNVVIVPQTGDIFLQEDGDAEQFVRGLTQDGEIFDFARTITNDSEFCGGCFDPNGQTLYLNQQGDRLGENEDPQGAPESRAITYAIYGPFENRQGSGDNEDDSDG